MNVSPEKLVSLGFVIFFAGAVYLSRDWLIQAKLFPWTIGIPGLILALVQLWRESSGWLARIPGAGQGVQVDEVYERLVPANIERIRTLFFFGWMGGTILAVWLLGFDVGVSLFVFLYTKIEAREGWGFCLAMTAGTVVLLYGLFEYYLGMKWAPGLLFY